MNTYHEWFNVSWLFLNFDGFAKSLKPSLGGVKRPGNLLDTRPITRSLRGVYPEPLEGLETTTRAVFDFKINENSIYGRAFY